MCGIVSIFNIQEQTPELRQQALRMSQKIRHRGPDWSGIYCGGSAILAHERLSIVDPESGRQPLFSPDKKQVLAVNGEIYNHQDIRSRFAGHYQYQTGSDCEVILSLYREMRADTDFATLIFQGEDAVHARICQMLEELNGIFAFALYDAEHDEFLIARDPIGVIPLYIGYDNDGKVMVASELKALEGQCDHYEPFLPGHYYYSKTPGMKRYYTRDWFEYASMQKKYNIDDSKKAAEQLAEELLVEEGHTALDAPGCQTLVGSQTIVEIEFAKLADGFLVEGLGVGCFVEVEIAAKHLVGSLARKHHFDAHASDDACQQIHRCRGAHGGDVVSLDEVDDVADGIESFLYGVVDFVMHGSDVLCHQSGFSQVGSALQSYGEGVQPWPVGLCLASVLYTYGREFLGNGRDDRRVKSEERRAKKQSSATEGKANSNALWRKPDSSFNHLTFNI